VLQPASLAAHHTGIVVPTALVYVTSGGEGIGATVWIVLEVVGGMVYVVLTVFACATLVGPVWTA